MRKQGTFMRVITLATFVACGIAGASASEWKKFTLATPYLAIEVPDTPKKIVRHTASFLGDIATEEYLVNDGSDAYSVEVTELPGFALIFAGPDTLYEHTKGALLKKTLSRVISFTDITLNGVKGKRLVYDTPTKPGHAEMQGEARMFLSGDWLYVADAVVEMKGGDKKQERFFSSLAIKK
ncbi:MAG: hypothetical protein R3286_12705 [Gammaproteobacteria bacterium]|nr:hypothetical protein [Gammaproteobacteria bacterium]